MASSPSDRRLAAVVFAVAFGVYAVCPIKTPFDSHWSIPTALSVIREGNFDLDEYRGTPISHGVLEFNGHLATEFPLGAPLVAIPFVFAFDRVVRGSAPIASLSPKLEAARARWIAHADATGKIDVLFFDTGEMLIASFLVALTAALLFLIARTRLQWPWALGLAFTFAFATSAWSTASRALWQHGPSMLMLTSATWLLLKAQERPRWAIVAGLPVALSYVMRPTNGIAVVAFSAYVLVKFRRQALGFFGVGALVAALLVALNWSIYGALFPPYYLPGQMGDSPGIGAALAGEWLSPSRGLLTFTPVFCFSFVGAAFAFRERTFNGLEWVMASAIVLHWLVISRFYNWYGGHCYGPRQFCDMAPFFVLFLVPVLERLRQPSSRGSWVALGGLGLAALLSFAIHLRGATTWKVYEWNNGPGDVSPERVWDFRDPQMLRGL